ncbi:peptide ABC transporter substrate-binding protein [Lactiplantibacillus fabifermentans]|uniref:Oligopeptide abc transporter, substrate binding protein n=2 Tax=Lactiplantibacillus fabifermentans TaxID=483011 RepID=A0A0R2NVJ0_9LACO|nr:peptide ABC transporter substrate-binding protein [Lactiplantibacillus fabifermentans]ETY74728.1 peptide ABC transporter substrate-binding protein [Lactiplantibacillus fabifermentans T30PCM01]KRO28555.1 oligopeptide abc transporter, substrate binding protein [Lactiplantibacillus fabifermentans DSM 21115]
MNLKTAAKVTVVAGASLLFLAACGSKSSSTSSSKQTANLTQNAELPTMDISKSTDVVSSNMLNNTNEGLYRIGKNGSITPGIAKATKVSNGGKTYTFTLRKNAKWSNGDKVTAHDFVYGWQRTVNPKTASQYAYLYSGIKNADQIVNGKKAVSTLGIKAEGDYKLVVTLDKPISYFKKLMGFVNFFPQNEKVVKKYGSKYGTTSSAMVYNGPYKMTGWTGTNLSWTLKKNNDYWDKKSVKMSSLKFQVVKDASTGLNLYNSNKVDDTILSSTQVKNYKTNKDYKVYKTASTFYIEMNRNDSNKTLAKAFKNKKIRQALSLAINRKEYVSSTLGDGSTVAKGYVSEDLAKNSKTGKDFTSDASVPSAVEYNQAKAKKLFKEGLKEIGETKLNIKLLSDDTDAGKKATEYIQGSWEKLPGLTVTNQNVPFKTRLSRSESGNFDTVISAWNADFTDPISFLSLFTSSNSYNNGKYSSSEYDSLINKANGSDANNTTARWNDMVKAEKQLMNDQGVIPIYQQATSHLTRTSLKGIIYNTAGSQYNYKYMSVK